MAAFTATDLTAGALGAVFAAGSSSPRPSFRRPAAFFPAAFFPATFFAAAFGAADAFGAAFFVLPALPGEGADVGPACTFFLVLAIDGQYTTRRLAATRSAGARPGAASAAARGS